ncbi:hypothetical protein HBI24_096310 [Parastagonospora nodorum]|nr:hypothetical protein HBI06_147540 [Parastagonospora nodorum]KAH4228416.1 hypothetical protein HBI05_204970 [Parastagonospora nodorum]KAH5102295.1 hypothetical protein HBH72_087510 [Parastagonospora nodorum]KAH5181635.1 hypothetical protein HBH76_162110 [Parastagonospora nodorum]KAH5203593.1 hypothetical protein HBH68_105690 [Parastagonospora nodorum]
MDVSLHYMVFLIATQGVARAYDDMHVYQGIVSMAKSKDASPPSGPPSYLASLLGVWLIGANTVCQKYGSLSNCRILDTTQVHGYYMANINVSLPDVFFFQRSRLPYLRETNAMGVAACKRSW